MSPPGIAHGALGWRASGMVCVALLACTITSVSAHELFPRAPGSDWVYGSDEACESTQLSRVVGSTFFAGSEVVELHHSRDLSSWSNYWTVGDSGVRLHGWSQEPDSLAVVYDPPLMWLPATVEVGATWSSLSTIVDGRTGWVVGEAHLMGAIVGKEIDSAGSANVDWEIEITVETKDSVQTSATSGLLGPTRGLARRGPLLMSLGYRSGIGLIRFPVCCDGTVMALCRSSVGVDLHEASWGTIKQVWRRGM